ncbi:MAG TPA: hypothetical protein PLL90_06860 [Bacteroidales bacterium]|nr:hypothetical protein [Bacteroidales bacterium]
MKTFQIFLISAAVVMMTAVGCRHSTLAGKEINIKLDSLSLNGKEAIENNLAKETSVLYVKAHLKKQVVTIIFDSVKGDQNQLMSALQKMGYQTALTGPVVPGEK